MTLGLCQVNHLSLTSALLGVAEVVVVGGDQGGHGSRLVCHPAATHSPPSSSSTFLQNTIYEN